MDRRLQRCARGAPAPSGCGVLIRLHSEFPIVTRESRLLRAGAATLFSHRLARLKGSTRYRARGAADLVLIMIYVAVLLACIIETIAHRPSCFRVVV